MSYNDKVMQLSYAIEPHVKLDNVEQAEELISWYKQPRDSAISKSVNRMAAALLDYQERFAIEQALKCIGTDSKEGEQIKLSALREAIALCAKRFVTRAELKQLVEIGDIDRRPMAAV